MELVLGHPLDHVHVVLEADLNGLFGALPLPGRIDVSVLHGEGLQFLNAEQGLQPVRHFVDEGLLNLLVGVQPFEVGIRGAEDVLPVHMGVPQSEPACVVAQVDDGEVLFLPEDAGSPADHLMV